MLLVPLYVGTLRSENQSEPIPSANADPVFPLTSLLPALASHAIQIAALPARIRDGSAGRVARQAAVNEIQFSLETPLRQITGPIQDRVTGGSRRAEG